MQLIVSVAHSAVLLSRGSSFNLNISSFGSYYRLSEVMKLLQKLLLLLLLAFPATLLLKGEFIVFDQAARAKVSLYEVMIDNSITPPRDHQ